MTLLVLIACLESEPDPEPDPVVDVGPPPEEAAALASAEAAAKGLGRALKGRLTEALAEGGAVHGLQACSEDAAGLAALVSGSQRARVGRSSLKLRNARNVGPDWVSAWLTEQGERPAAGVIGVSQVVEGTARFLAPIEVGGECLVCHGTAVEADVLAELAVRYPDDQAIGYAVGDLRGAVWAEAKVR